MKLHLVDGTYELFRAYFGAPKRSAPDGREVGAIRGIMASMLSLVAEPGITHVAAAFDTVIESFRNTVYPEYKTGAGIDQELLDQFLLAERGIASLGITVWSMYDYEADDALATAACRWSGEVDHVVVMTPDKDLCQLYGDHGIVGYDRRKGSLHRSHHRDRQVRRGPSLHPRLAGARRRPVPTAFPESPVGEPSRAR